MVVTPKTHSALSRPKQTAEHFQVSTMTLWRWRQDPAFPQPLQRGQVVLYDIAAIEAWLNAGVVA